MIQSKWAAATGCLLFVLAAQAQVPPLVNYQGRVVVGSTNFNGTGQFKFALVNTNGSTTYWSNDGTSSAGSQPTAHVSLTVSNGLYAVQLGDTALANMTALPASVFNNSDVRLRVWFNDGTTGFQQLSPDQRLAAVGYAMMADGVKDGAITSAKLAPNAVIAGNIANGAVGTAQLAPGALALGQNIAGTTQLGQANTHYNATSASLTTLTLPTNAAVGNVVQITGTGTGGWTANVMGGQSVINGIPGITWIPRENNRNWISVASSADGTKLVATVGILSPGGQIYTSTDSGESWTPRESDRLWASVASSDDGSKLVAMVGSFPGGQIYTSTDSGVSWTARMTDQDRNWTSVASSDDGSKLVAAVAGGGQIYTSTDSGVSWTPRESNRTWRSVASSADGTKLVAVETGLGGRIYTSVAALSGTQGSASALQYLGNGRWKGIEQNQVAPGAVGNAQLVSAAVQTGNIADGAVGSSQLATGAVGSSQLATNAVQTGNIADGMVTNAKLAPDAVNTTNIVNGAVTSAKLDSGLAAGLWTSASGNVYRATGTVGIGTANPGALLHLVSGNDPTIKLQSDSFDEISGRVSLRQSNDTGFDVYYDGTQAVDGLVFESFSSGTPTAKAMVMKLNGTVGIGTINPQATLEVRGSGPGNVLMGGWAGGNTYGFISLNNSNSTGGYNFVSSASDTNLYINRPTAANIHFRENNANQMTIASGGNVGIGTTNPGANNLQINPTFGPATGFALVASRADFGANVQINRPAGQGGIGLVVDNAADGDGSTHLFLVRNNVAGTLENLFDILANGNVGIGTTSPSHLLHVTGPARSTQANWDTSSDERVKEDIRSLTGSLEKLEALRPVTFEYTPAYRAGHAGLDGTFTGFLAQDVEEIFPEMVSSVREEVGSDKVLDDFRLLNLSGLLPHVVAGVQELKAENEALRKRTAELEERLRRLEKKDKPKRESRSSKMGGTQD